ncbi:MAG: histidine phosphotransferase family protein [Pseudomonadota bacterium]
MERAPDPLELAALLCSRVCHDVVNPVGAIANGLEVLDDGDDEDLRTIAFDVIRKSTNQAKAKLQFARLAYGASSSSGATIDLGDAKGAATEFFSHEKPELVWELPHVAVAKDEAKLILNMLLVAGATIPRGGVITVSGDVDPALTSLSLVAEGPLARIPEKMEAHVTGKSNWGDVDAREAQHYYTGLIAELVGIRMVMTLDGERVSINGRRQMQSGVEFAVA